MSKFKIVTSAILIASINLVGCASDNISNMMSSGSAAPIHNPNSKFKNVKIYYGNANLPKKYKIVGHVSAENYNMIGMEYSQSDIAEELKKQAMKIGANGVINVSSGLTQTTGDGILVK